MNAKENINRLLITDNIQFYRKAHKLLVLLGFDITVFTPVAYQRRNLRRLLREVSS